MEPELDMSEVEKKVADAIEDEVEVEQEIEQEASQEVEQELTEEQVEEEASKRGWTAEGTDKFGYKLSAQEFLDRKPMFDTIGNLKKKTDTLEDKLNKLTEQNQKIAAKSIEKQQKLMTELEQAKKELLNQDYLDDEGVKNLKDIDEKITSVREDVTEASVSNGNEDEWDDALLEFTSNNAWYGTNAGLTQAAEVFAKRYTKENKNSTPKDYYGSISQSMMEKFGEQMMFPDKEAKVRKPNIGSNNNRQPLREVKKSKTLDDIPEDQRAIAREVMESTGINEEEYLKTYF